MIKVVTDSTCDLPVEVIDELGISVVPLYINIGEKGYLDGIEMTRQDFYTNLPEFATHPTTGTPSAERFQKTYQELFEQGASQILSIHITEHLSATVNIARSAAANFDQGSVVVQDSEQLSFGTGFQVKQAAEMAKSGKGMKEIISVISDMAMRTLVAASLDTLEFLRRSGRMNGLMKGIGSLIQLKPILTMSDGAPSSEMVRTSARAFERLVEMVHQYQPIEKFALLHTNAAAEAEKLRSKIQSILPVEIINSVDITPVIGAHLGPGAVGFAVMTQASSKHP